MKEMPGENSTHQDKLLEQCDRLLFETALKFDDWAYRIQLELAAGTEPKILIKELTQEMATWRQKIFKFLYPQGKSPSIAGFP